MNRELMFSRKTGMWATPQDFFDKLNEEFHFGLDVCATPDNAKCSNFFTEEVDGLKQNWGGKEQFGAIHHTEEKSASGLRKPTKHHSKGKRLSCSSMREQIQDGFTIGYMAKLKSVLLKADSSLVGVKIQHRSQAW